MTLRPVADLEYRRFFPSSMRASPIFNTLLGLLAMSCPVEAATPAVGAPPAVAREAPAREGPAFTASLGLGYGYGIFGVQVRNDRSLRPWLHLSPFVAGGINSSFGWTAIVGAFGLSAGLGWRHRLAADVAIAPVTWQELNLHGTRVDTRTIYGPNVAGGYEHVSVNGWLQRVTFGYAWGEWGQGSGPFPSTVTLTMGVGRRIW